MSLRFDVVTIFPEMFPGPLAGGVLGRALQRGLLDLRVHDLREHADPPHRQVDDEPFGGGAGMVFKPEPLFRSVDSIHRELQAAGAAPGPVVLLSPQGRRFDHDQAARLAATPQVTLVCGRYEGVDERFRAAAVDLEISIGDYVLTGGELAAMVVVEAAGRLVPEALGDPDSARRDSFVAGLLDHPHYTRPAVHRGRDVPAVLRSGNHAEIERWRRREALRNTALKRPDLLADVELDAAERDFVDGLLEGAKVTRETDEPALQ